MSDNQKYYYFRLKESYFEEEAIILLESMPDGILYSNILLKLYLLSLKNGGKLQLDEQVPYNAQMIAAITRQQIGTIERALQIFVKLGLVELLENGTLYMRNIELLIGQSSTEGERKRKARLALSGVVRNDSGQMSGHMADICPPEIGKKKVGKGQAVSAAYGKYHNVFLTEQERNDLQNDFPHEYKDYIERLSQYMASSGKQYKSHAATISYWITTDQAREQKKKGSSIPDYSFKESESL